MKKLILLVCLSLLTHTGYAREGGELGNPGGLDNILINERVGYEIRYPESWNALEGVASDTLFSNLPLDASKVAITHNLQPGVQSIDELLEYLQKKNPGIQWKKGELNGRNSVVGQFKGETHYYVFGRSGVLIELVRLESVISNPKEQQALDAVVSSFQID